MSGMLGHSATGAIQGIRVQFLIGDHREQLESGNRGLAHLTDL